ncbi:DNA-formamidopyrimidine glycosylase family protein [[Flexibacter] sp. ATCC 35208]|uniref:DNA-formamidopyrimidine glycosylase family protein n=1 Tax=[Flexibacter] sp. ATCC 35208 TaxID=1936242 RepID=UPI0009D16780|nr:DNA-formamidopyrimidine glycosylase family protein [[Flexibacter] sp. ATCC 35208]OMP76787.1 endonuclease [[Flexibacter] sp. ATCC 35208]
MPEGPSIVILKKAISHFKGKKILAASGYAKIDLSKLKNKKITAIKSWGKHLLICFNTFTIRIHLLLFGTYLINNRKPANPTLRLTFTNDELNFYTCSVIIIDQPLNEVYDWEIDLLSDQWNAEKVLKQLKKFPDMLACDALLNQDIFAGSGNIIKNEVLFRTHIHPLSKVGKLPLKKKKELVQEARQYSFDFLEWKKTSVLKQHWLAHTRKTCPRCHIAFNKEYLGTTRRRSFFCNNCQFLYE